MTIITEAIGKNIRAHRKLKKLSQEKLALDLDMSPSYLCSIENGTANPTIQKLVQIASQLDVPFEELILGRQASGVEPNDPSLPTIVPQYRYRVISTYHNDEYLGRYLTCGLELEQRCGEGWIHIDYINDISTSYETVSLYSQLFTFCDLHPIHVYDVLEDLPLDKIMP